MRLEVTRRTDLATRALLTLASSDERRKAADLAIELEASPGFLSQALTPLVNQGWVRSDPGPTGGYRLTVDLGALSVLDVVEAVEGTTDVTKCVLEDRACAGGGVCALHDAWARARGQLLHELADTPLDSIRTARSARPPRTARSTRTSSGRRP
jgi:Rrf2 family protein